MLEKFKEFQVKGCTENSVQAFLDTTGAQDQLLEDWTGAYIKAGMDVVGWGCTNMPIKRLNRLADQMGVALISIFPVEGFEQQDLIPYH